MEINMIELEKYRDKWLAEGFDDHIGFYNREFYCLDNFSSFKIKYKGRIFSTVEHAYQAYKFMKTDRKIANEIINAFSADETKRIAGRNADKIRADWDDVKLQFMEEFLRCKLEQNPYVKEKLLMTKNYTICEDSPKDEFWGIGPNRNGRNELGKLWMKLRAELQSKPVL